MFGAFSEFIETASGAAKQYVDDGYKWLKQTGIMDLEEGFNDEEVEKSTQHKDELNSAESRRAGVSEFDPQVTKKLIADVPMNWESAAEEWRTIIDAALMEENGAIIPPSTITSNTDLTNKICQLVGIDSAEDLPQIPDKDLCIPTTEAVDILSTSPVFLQFRTSLVPRCVSDEQYWINIWWRFQIYHMCRNSFQLIDVMNTVTTEPNPVDETGNQRRKGIGVPNSEMYWKKLRDDIMERRTRNESIMEQITKVQTEIEVMTKNLQLLTSIIKKEEVNELGDSVFGSCTYHKKKIAHLVDELKAQQEEIEALNFSTTYGSIMQQLLDLDEQLQSCIDAYTALRSGNASDAREILSHTDVKEKAGSPCWTPPGKNNETVFEVALPWEEDLDSNGKQEDGESV